MCIRDRILTMYRISLRSRFQLFSALLLAGIVCALLPSNTVVYADSMPGGNVADASVRAVDIAQPAVVRMITTIYAHITVQIPSASSVTFPQTASSNANGYELQVSGTGTFITSQGDILTADHVINPPEDSSLEQDVYSTSAADIASYINQHAAQGSAQLSSSQVDQELISGQLKSTIAYGTPSSLALLSTSYTGPLSTSSLSDLPAGVATAVDKVEKESPPDQQDTAIVHVALSDTPDVQLGNSSNVSPQDTLTIIGFPGNADVSDTPTDFLSSSVNQIYVSSIKTSASGAPLIQVGGNVEHGDSGGPALDSSGNVVGIVSFGLTSNGSSGGTSFLQASNSARSLVSALKLNTTPGKFQTAWNQAFTAYAASTPGHWHTAFNDFKQIASAYPAFKAVQPYLNYAQTQAQHESQTAVSSTPTTTSGASSTSGTSATGNHLTTFSAVAWTIAVVMLLLLLVSLFCVTAVRRRKPTARSSTTPAGRSTTISAPLSDSKSKIVPIQRRPSSPTAQSPSASALTNTQSTLTLKAWPCGHMNRSSARFCSICGEPAPAPSASRRLEP